MYEFFLPKGNESEKNSLELGVRRSESSTEVTQKAQCLL
jgi:hypothetical protein